MFNYLLRAIVLLAVVLGGCQSSLKFKDGMVACSRDGHMRDCVAVPMATSQADSHAKQFSPPAAHMARLYVVRTSMLQPVTKSQIYVDNELIGFLAPKTFLMMDMPPGVHVVSAQTKFKSQMELHLEAGQSYFIQQDMYLLLFKSTEELKIIEIKEGKNAVRASKRAEIIFPK